MELGLGFIVLLKRVVERVEAVVVYDVVGLARLPFVPAQLIAPSVVALEQDRLAGLDAIVGGRAIAVDRELALLVKADAVDVAWDVAT